MFIFKNLFHMCLHTSIVFATEALRILDIYIYNLDSWDYMNQDPATKTASEAKVQHQAPARPHAMHWPPERQRWRSGSRPRVFFADCRRKHDIVSQHNFLLSKERRKPRIKQGTTPNKLASALQLGWKWPNALRCSFKKHPCAWYHDTTSSSFICRS